MANIISVGGSSGGGKNVVGTYTGDGTSDARLINIGFTPSFVFIRSKGLNGIVCKKFSTYISFTDRASYLQGGSNTNYLCGDSGFYVSVNEKGSSSDSTNDSGIEYFYMAIGQ